MSSIIYMPATTVKIMNMFITSHQITKLKCFRNESDVLHSRGLHGFGECGASQAVTHSSQRILGKSKVYRALEEAWRNGMIG